MTNVQGEKDLMRQNIVELFEIDKLPAEKREETIARIGGIIFQSVLVRVLPALSEGELDEYEKLLEKKPGADELLDFFFEKVPLFAGIVAEETENFRREAAEVLKQL